MDGESERPEMRAIPALPKKFVDGKDEMNFAEFPLGTIAERLDPGTKTLVFEDQIFDKSRNQMVPRKLTITGSDAYGLPTSTDDEVLLGLIQLSKLQKFADRRVFFSRYQLIKLLRWPVSGQSYDRIDQALNRWIGVTLYYENAWRDKQTNAWVDEKIHILERVKIYSQENERAKPKPDQSQGNFEFASSFFLWNEAVFRSFDSGNLKALDYDFVLGLKSSISRRLYRFLDKRFFYSPSLEFELKHLGYEHIGLSRNTPVGDLKRKLGGAMDELVEKGFLKDLPKSERFTKLRVGIWHVKFEKAPPGQGRGAEKPEKEEVPRKEQAPSAAISVPAEKENLVQQKLVASGVSEEKARALSKQFPAEKIEEKILVLQFLVERNDPKVQTNPAGFLIRSIELNFAPPRNFVSPSVQKAKEEARLKKGEALKAKEKRRIEKEQAEEKKKRDAIDGFWNGLSAASRKLAEEAAMKEAGRLELDLMKQGGELGRAARQLTLDNYALGQLARG